MDEDELAVRIGNDIVTLVSEHGYSRDDIDNIVDNAMANAEEEA